MELPVEIKQIADNVSAEKRNEVQSVLNSVFDGVSKMRAQLDTIIVSDEKDAMSMQLASNIRLAVKRVRLDAEKTFDSKRAEVQAKMLSYKTEDSLWLKAKQTMQILTKEIEEQARWKEETKQRYEAEQKELKVQQRIVKVAKFDSEINRIEFESMTDDSFNLFLSGIEKKYNDKIEAERKAEQERIAKEKADAEERERMRVENERLKEERKKLEEKAKLEREKQAKIQAELEAKAKAEREEKERIQAELLAKKQKEEMAVKEKLEAERKAKAAPDKEKLITLRDNIDSLHSIDINLSSDEAKKILQDVYGLLAKVSKFMNDKIESL